MTSNVTLNKELISQVIYWHENHFNDDQIKLKLIEKNHNSDEIEACFAALAKHKDQKKRTRGTLIIVAGVLLLGIGFILTVSFFHSGKSINGVMYGLTSLGLILVFWGCKEVFH